MKRKLGFYALDLGIVLAIFAVLQILIATNVINSYYTGIIIMVCVNIILAVSLNLSTGYLGQLVLGHAGFMAVGAYTAAMFTLDSGVPESFVFPISLLLGGIVAAIVGFLIGIPALRLRGDYLAIITLGFGEIIRVIILNMKPTGGARGLRGIPNLTSFAWVFFLAVLTVVVVYAFINSRHGRAVKSIREDEIAAEASGINTTYYKMLAFVMSAFLAGIAGGLFAHHNQVLVPTKFDFNYSVEILIMVVLGGMGSTSGAVIAAVVLTILPEALRSFSDYRMLLYSAILICMMLFKPSGLLGQREISIHGFIRWIKKKLGGKKQAATVTDTGEEG